ncbi:hypothetical protein FRC07_014669 [Ceratobasidium sp. 392]|nr:hypothetical protein FRC07_014669 [Ceratobasidium sp. 392]
MQESAIPAHWHSQVAAAHQLISSLSDHGDKQLLKDIQHWAASSILSDTYGYQLSPNATNDPLLQTIEELIELVARGVSSAKFLVNLFPILKHVPEWIPGGGFKAVARRGRKLKEQVLNVPFEWAKTEMAKGTAQSSYVSRSLSQFQASYEDLVKFNAGAMFGAGYDTTVSTLLAFFIVMQLYPDVQTRARQEVLGTLNHITHIPDPAAVLKLDYLRRVLKELLRWLPALPLGIPHAVVEDDEYQGYIIPAGSIVIANHWAISRDPSIYPDPESFNPDRFLNIGTPHETPFGYGRSMHVANSNMLIAFAYLLVTFDIEKAVTDDGSPIEPSVTLKKDVHV